MKEDNRWLPEAVVDFLRGPLYINPLMAFIDQKCLIFTPEDENKIEYSIFHQEFKQLVDCLLTDFIAELGVSAEKFYEVVAEQNDSLNSFVVQTILTVDDFLLFKSMMVKRNIDLTNQVLAAVDAMKQAALGGPGVGAGRTAEEEALMLEEALQLSSVVNADEMQTQRLRELMRGLQMEDEDIAMAIALANSLKDETRLQGELAELQQAIALSEALEMEEQRRLLNEASKGGAPSSYSASTSAKAQGVQYPAGSYATTPTVLDPLAPLNIGPNTAAEKMSAIAAAAEANARALAAAVVEGGISGSEGAKASSLEGLPSLVLNKGQGSQPAVAADARLGGRSVASVDPVPPSGLGRLPPLGGAQLGRLGPAPLPSIDKSPKKPSEDLPSENLILGGGRTLQSQGSVRNAAGYKPSSSPDLASIREAAQAAADTQKGALAAHMSGGSGSDEAAQKWLQEQKLKLVAQKKAERDAETELYRQQKGFGPMVPPGADGGSVDLESRRAALREKLSQKFKEDLVKQAFE